MITDKERQKTTQHQLLHKHIMPHTHTYQEWVGTDEGAEKTIDLASGLASQGEIKDRPEKVEEEGKE